MMKGQDSNLAVTAILVTLSILAGAAIWDSYSWHGGFCGEAETNCLRDWLGLIGVYLAFGAATTTAIYIRRQLAEARRQTEFMLGESLPTMTARYPRGQLSDATLRIVNWNRSEVDLNSVLVSDAPFQINVVASKVHASGQPETSSNLQGRFIPSYRIPGWENRNATPPTCEIPLYLGADPEELVFEGCIEVEFCAQLTLYGDRERRIEIRSRMLLEASDLR